MPLGRNNDEFCAYHAALTDEIGSEVVAMGEHMKKRNARHRVPIAESRALELNPNAWKSPSAVRPALALTAVDELETIRTVLLEAARSTSSQGERLE